MILPDPGNHCSLNGSEDVDVTNWHHTVLFAGVYLFTGPVNQTTKQTFLCMQISIISFDCIYNAIRYSMDINTGRS